MKTLKDHIDEALKIGKNLGKFSTYSCQPLTRNELVKLIRNRIAKEGNNCDLNDIDVSQIDDMTSLFTGSSFNGNISEWNVSNVKRMNYVIKTIYFIENHFKVKQLILLHLFIFLCTNSDWV